MHVKTTIINKQISLKNIELKFSYCGIYIISGENGSGKTSVIKKIAFDEKNIIFDNEKLQHLFDEDRGQVIGYVEQDPVAYDVSLHKYLTRFSKETDDKKMEEYLKQFNLEHLRLGQNICKLSGGELTKANIIASLLKESQYIFMDEPTNNLDNESVRQFVSIISEYAKNHTVIIVSHDPRMKFEDVTEYSISNNSIIEKKTMTRKEKNVYSEKKNSFSLKNIINNYVFSLSGLASFLFNLVAIFLLAFVNYIVYYSTMAVEPEIQQKDIIVGYKADEQYSELNKIYADNENIDVNEEKYYQMIYFDDLERLLEDKKIEKILLPDIEYIDKLNEKIIEYGDEEAIIDELLLFSVPEQIIKNFSGQITLPYNVLMLKRGRMPRDNCYEVIISERLAEEYFKINASQALGKKVDIFETEYTVVGIGYSDIAVISYNEGDKYGYFSLADNVDKLEALENYFVENEYYLTNGTSEEVFIIKDGCEKEVLDYFIKNYPAENYASAEFEKVFSRVTNEEASNRLLLINIVGMAVISVIIIFINRKRLKINENKAVSIDNYYCRKNYTLGIYRKVNYCGFCICALVAGLIIHSFYNEVFMYCLVGLILGAILQLLQFIGIKNEY